jgi:hypothetical protein
LNGMRTNVRYANNTLCTLLQSTPSEEDGKQ